MVMVCSATAPPGATSSRIRRKKTGHHFSPTASNISIDAIAENVSPHVAVVLQPDVDAVVEPGLRDLARRPRVLLLGERDAGDAAAGLARGVHREPAPAAADLEEVVLARTAAAGRAGGPTCGAGRAARSSCRGVRLVRNSAEEYVIVSSSHRR